MKKEFIKVISATALCLGLFGAAFVGINNITLAAASEGTRPLQLAAADIETPITNTAPIVSEEHQKPNMEILLELGVLLPGVNALTYVTAAEIGAQYIWDMFGESLDGKTVLMAYNNHPSAIRAFWIGRVVESGEIDLHDHAATLFTFSLDAITGEYIDILTTVHSMEPSEAVRAALTELQGQATEEAIAIRTGGAAPTQLGEYIETAKKFAQIHFRTTEVVSAEFINVTALGFDIDQYGNLFANNRQLIFEVTDSTGRIAEIAIVEATRQLIWVHTSGNDIMPGFNYIGAEPGRG